MDGIWGWILWIVIGALAGWIASMIMGTNGSQGLLMDIIVGIIGGVLGGWLFGLIGLGDGGFWWSLLTAIVGAIILIAILRLLTGGRRTV